MAGKAKGIKVCNHKNCYVNFCRIETRLLWGEELILEVLNGHSDVEDVEDYYMADSNRINQLLKPVKES